MLATTLALGALLGGAIAEPSLTTPVDSTSLFKRASSGCSTTGATSCHNTTAQRDLCCFESPGGLLLQTQFWDTNPSTGPSNSWTIHGLWPDNCDGTFEQNCDSSRAYSNIADLLSAQGASDTLAFMRDFWVDINGRDEQFWAHEWSTHGTCYSTLKTSCLASGSPRGAEAVAFFNTVVKLFKTLPTYNWLAAAGITPSTSKTYTLSTLTSALKSASGVTPALNCNGATLNAIEWYFNLKGSVIDGVFVPIDAPSKGSCGSSGIRYPPKSGSTTTTRHRAHRCAPNFVLAHVTHDSLTKTAQSPGSLPSKGTIHASTTGGLLTSGTWSVQTLATYTFSGSASSFTMSTSKGSCGVSGGKLTCGSGVSASTFSAVSSGGNLLLAFSGSTAFSSDATPSGTAQQTVFTGSGHGRTYTLSIVSS
ncbi:ribonuclease T2 [Earliella scabrosa]|nr:ribonuclease T2 [Earliella scabrosa]